MDRKQPSVSKGDEYLNSKNPTSRQLPEKAFHQQPKPKNK